MSDHAIGVVLILVALLGFAELWRWTRDETPTRPDPSDSAGA